jgi:hypothetical protein
MAKNPLVDVVAAALVEARRRGDRRLGTEHLLLGLIDRIDAYGGHLPAARAALDALDREALAAIGIDPSALPQLDELPRHHPPVTLAMQTAGAREALRCAVAATTVRTRQTASTHLLRALQDRPRPDPVAALIERLGAAG